MGGENEKEKVNQASSSREGERNRERGRGTERGREENRRLRRRGEEEKRILRRREKKLKREKLMREKRNAATASQPDEKKTGQEMDSHEIVPDEKCIRSGSWSRKVWTPVGP